MAIPNFTESGDLPIGVHKAALPEVLQRFGQSTSRRRVIATRLERIYNVATGTGLLYRIVVFGSFVTSKSDPNDVDIFILMENEFDVGQLTGDARLLFDHGAAATFFGASVFWIRRLASVDGEQNALEYWQVKRDGGFRGIVEIVENVNDQE